MMTALATVADVAARLGRSVADDEQLRIEAFLADVSALVRDHCGLDFALHQDEAVRLEPVGGAELVLPHRLRPISAVHTASWADGSPVDRWFYSRGSLWRADGWVHIEGQEHERHITITATYGYPAVPEIVIGTVCAEVIRWLAVQPGVMSERVGEMEISYGATAPTQGLSPAALAALRRYRRTVVSRDVWRPPVLR
ncbi:phage gp6-like head-tail connector protein [Streptomyces sp. NPDC057654]|uniref:phage gp6-like head-tail connector protein n=1 Tax=Streptomyces sp. NPDC057654 TaxID=3346196 RepID=UPI0036916EF0